MTVWLLLLIAVNVWSTIETRRLRLSLVPSDDQPAETELICLHPSEYRTDISTSGVWRWRCDQRKGGCGHEHEQQVRSEGSIEQLAILDHPFDASEIAAAFAAGAPTRSTP